MSDLLGISSTAVAAYQRALGTVSNNIANVSTEGYSRQTSTLQQSAPAKQANMYLGTGVLFTSVKRAFDTFAESNLRNSNTDLATQSPMVEYTQRVMDIMGDKSVGLSSALDAFFESARSLSVDPASGVMRTSFLRSTEGVGSRFAELSGQLNLVSSETRQALDSSAGELNTLTEQLSLVNQQLTKGTTLDSQPPELLDRRDLLLRQISEYSRIKTSFTANGIVSVSLGTTMKQSLVVDGIKSRPVGMDPNSNSKLDMVIDPYGNTEPLAGASGGTFGGLNTFISQVLEPAQKNLDFLAQTFVDEVNKIQKNGIDGYGDMGSPLLKIDVTAVNKAQGIGMVLSDPMRVATGALFRVSESNDNASDVKAKVAYTPPAAPLGVSNARLINNPFTSTPVPIEVGGGRLFAPVTTLSAGMENPVIYLDNVKPGQQLQVLTSDGRHLIGSEMSIDEKYQVLTKENGFSDPVTFSDVYLNKSGVNGYLQTHVFYGAKGSVVYAQQFDRLGQPMPPTPTPAKLETAHIQQLQAGSEGLTLIAAGAIKLNNSDLGPLTLAANETLTPQKVATWLQKGMTDNKITDMKVEVFNQIRFNAAALDFRKALSLNGIKIGTVNQDAKVANEYKDLPSMVKAIQAAQDKTGVTARIADNGDLILENALGHEGETITLGPKDSNGQSSNAFNLNLSGANGVIQGQVRLTRTLGDPAKSDIRLSFGSTSPNAGSPFDLSMVGLRTAAYIEGKVPDDLQVFVTGEGKASVAASFSGQPADPQQKLRSQKLIVSFDAPSHYTIKDGATGTILAERNYDTSVLNPVVNYQGLAIQFTRAPDVGDVFEVDGNHDGLGNNENMLVMADLSKKGVIGNKSFSDSYIDQVNTVGNAAQQAKITQQALTVVNDQAKQSRDKVSGVNLDDEAADLIRFQQAYQAAAKSLQISGQLFDSIVQIR
ncbi:MAG: flagellar hook-associated protein FlgK [Betaproteobacteria bacterium]|nr:flagellar hook-associated protein FlgK [Betaproteobacteria bacterium]